MNLVKACIERPVAVIVAAMLTVLAGLFALAAAPVQLTPEVEPTYVTVGTYWEGASPAEVESEIILEQEERLRGVANLVKMISVCEQNQGSIRLEFKLGTDKDSALLEVSDKLRQVPDYPENVDEPTVESGDFQSRDYIAWILARCADPNYDVRDSFDFFEDRVKPYLERTPGLSEIGVLGGRERETQIRVNTDAMANRGVTVGQLVNALRGENVDVSAGQIPEGKRDVRLRIVGKYESPEQILQTVIAADRSGAPVYVRDIATVHVTLGEPRSIVRSKGATVLALNAQREVGSNVLSVMNGLQDRLAELNGPGGLLEQEARRLGLSAPIVLDQVYDQTIYIHNALDLVVGNIYVGGALAVLCLLAFLRSIRATLIIALTIPVSVIGSFIVLPALGRNINVISLAGMAFAVGMVVDNAIVVLENIYRRRQMGESAMKAAYNGAREVWVAILVSTLTTVIVFIPVLTIQDEVGQLFRDIAIAISAAVLLSLAAAVIVIPPFAARLLTKGFDGDGGRGPGWRAPLIGAARGLAKVRDGYVGLLGRSLGSWTVRLGTVTAIVLLAVLGAAFLTPPASYLPPGNRNLIFGFLIPPPGYNLSMQTKLGERIEETLAPYWSVKAGTPEAAALPPVPQIDFATGAVRMIQPPPIGNFFFVAFGDAMFMGADSQVETRVQPIVPLLQFAAGQDKLPGVFAIPFQAPLFNIGGFGGGNSIDLEISGDSLEEVKAAALALMGAAFALQGEGVFESVRPDPGNFNIAAQEVQLKVDPVRAAQNGVTVRDIAAAVTVLGDGLVIGDYRQGGENIDLRVIDERQADWSAPELELSDLAAAPIATPAGNVVAIGSLGTPRRVDSPQQIRRIEGRRSVTLTMSAPAGMALEAAMTAVRERMIEPLRASGAVPPTVDTTLAGAANKLSRVREAMLGEWGGGLLTTLGSIVTSRLFLALLCCYLLMCALFESFLYPFVILVSVPLAMAGGMVGLRIVHFFDATQQLDTLSMLGFVILIGVVVNNAILLVSQSLNFMRGFGESEEERIERMPARRAILESTRTRFRPIMMTMLTSVLGMAPLVIKPGAGSELYRGLGAVVLSGLVFSTLFTLVLAPMLLSMVIDLRVGLSRLFGREWDPGRFERVRIGEAPVEPRDIEPASRSHVRSARGPATVGVKETAAS